MALMRGCHRCKTGHQLTVTRAHVAEVGVLVEVRLCAECREQADAENAAARTRGAGQPGRELR